MWMLQAHEMLSDQATHWDWDWDWDWNWRRCGHWHLQDCS